MFAAVTDERDAADLVVEGVLPEGLAGACLPVGEQNTLVRVDTTTGSIEKWVSGQLVFDEVVFVPAPGGGPEEGFYVTFRTDRGALTSDFVVLAADDLSAGSIARVPLPFRVTAGLHGNWFPTE